MIDDVIQSINHDEVSRLRSDPNHKIRSVAAAKIFAAQVFW